MENFRERVLAIIAAVPRGKVVSYGQVAAAAGSPRAARQVGGILRGIDPFGYESGAGIHSPRKIPRKGRRSAEGGPGRKGKPRPGFPSEVIPWWRVINSEGFISIKGNWEATKEIQAELLRREGVAVGEDFTVDMGRYRYNP